MKDLTNQKFGRLMALSPTSERRNGCIIWKCQCDCGNICYISSHSLKTGNTKSCGCLNAEKRKARIVQYNKEHHINLKGERRGILTIISSTNLRQNGNVVWKCQCDCGNICYISSNNLNINRKNYTQSCGCLKHNKWRNYKNLIGEKFGKLTVIKPTLERKFNQVVWKCRCDCGNICFVPSGSLTSHSTQSCGCLKSKGEEKIINLLQKNNIPFQKEKIFNNCIFETSNHPRFDFYVDNKYLIEYDGIQHFQQTGWEALIEIQARDNFKTQWCKENNVPIIRIPYTKYDSLCIEDLLLETSQFIV